MIMSGNNKKAPAMVIQKLRDHMGESHKPAVNVEGAEDSSPKVIAADEVLAAIEAKDPRALADAMSSLVELCSYSEEE